MGNSLYYLEYIYLRPNFQVKVIIKDFATLLLGLKNNYLQDLTIKVFYLLLFIKEV